MPMIQTDSQHYSDIADAIRDMTDSQTEYYPSEMAAGIRSIPQEIVEEDYFDPVIYSLTEREIGVWTDGKPLYEKTVHHTNQLTTFSDYVTIETIANIDTVVSITGIALRRGTMWYVIPSRPEFSNNYKYMISCRVYSGSIQYIIDQYGDQVTDMYITVRYTKTSDTAGSGSWTPSGVPAHHYSTTEQVIGTWIDGKTLYEKVIEFTQELPVSTSSWTSTDIDSTNIDVVVSGFAIYHDGTNYGAILADPTGTNHTKLELQCCRNTQNDVLIKYLILQYTKSST